MPKNMFMLRLGIIFFTLILSFAACKTTKFPSTATAKSDIMAVMQMQEKAWSDGDLELFMSGYWKSDQLSFVGSRGLTEGWQQTFDGYMKGYPTKADMGKLTFEIIRLNPISGDAYHMIGKYTLEREKDTPTGFFSLLWKYIDGKWYIISDHTSGS